MADYETEKSFSSMSARLMILELVLEPFILPTDSEMKQLWVLERQGRSRETLLAQGFNWGMRDYPAKSLQSEIERFNTDLKEACIHKLFADVRRVVATSSFDAGGCQAYGRLEALAGERRVLQQLQVFAKRAFENSIKKGLQENKTGMLVWYARWLVKYVGRNASRIDVEHELADLCREIYQGERAPPNGWRRNDFDQFIQPLDVERRRPGRKKEVSRVPDGESVDVTPGFRDYKLEDLFEIAEIRLIKADMLPPLAKADFPPLKGGKNQSGN